MGGIAIHGIESGAVGPGCRTGVVDLVKCRDSLRDGCDEPVAEYGTMERAMGRFQLEELSARRGDRIGDSLDAAEHAYGAAIGNGGVCAGYGKSHGKNLGSAKRRTPVKGNR